MATSLVGKQIGNYKITKLLGEGGMGAVYLGEHPLIGKKVAVKVLHDELAVKEDIVSRFFTEALAFIAGLQRGFDGRRRELLERRVAVQAGVLPRSTRGVLGRYKRNFKPN